MVRRYHKRRIAVAVVAVAVGAFALRPHHNPTPITSNAVCHVNGSLPDSTCTPGVADPRVTQANIGQTICVSGYTGTVRPPVTVTAPEKLQSMREYGYPTGTAGEYDHLIALELGGSNDTKNLWFEAGPIPNPKDAVENRLHKEICAGQITLIEAQREISTDWTTAK